jgi:hypothetical protein
MSRDYTDKGAIVSPDGRYRYQLWRQWGEGDDAESCVFIMLNPSTADGETDDPTIRKCVGFADRWGWRRIDIVNLFAYRATKPADLFKADNPVGPYQQCYIRAALFHAAVVVCAWGSHGGYRSQDKAVISLLDAADVAPFFALGFDQKGRPRHPLMMPYGEPVVYRPSL